MSAEPTKQISLRHEELSTGTIEIFIENNALKLRRSTK